MDTLSCWISKALYPPLRTNQRICDRRRSIHAFRRLYSHWVFPQQVIPRTSTERTMTMKKNHEPIIRISPNVNSQASVLELPGPEYSSHDEQSLGQVGSLIQDLAEKTDRKYLV